MYQEKRTKLEPTRRKGSLIGYRKFAKGYRVYIPRQNEIELSRDAIFEEGVAFKIAKGSN